MTGPSIQVDGLGKMYRIPRPRDRAGFGDDRRSGRRRLLGSLVASVGGAEEESLWALRDATFEVAQGEVIGIIGANGAGKSTLLKILARITEPTEGRATLYGRVGSILEVGTGFHPELTGRENIQLSGAIMGMKRAEIARKFDEIVAFSGVEAFVDTPVKRYSSGMYVRLAFAVAAHMDPEILIVDEVLAVGDAAFQRKCLGKLGDAAGAGRTVVLVSHNMAAVSNLCRRVVCLAGGRVVHVGEAKEGVARYLNLLGGDGGATTTLNVADRSGVGPLRFVSFHCESADGDRTAHLVSGRTVRFVLGYESPPGRVERVRLEEVSIVVYTADGSRLTNLSSLYFDSGAMAAAPPAGQFVCVVPRLPLRSGRYTVALYCKADGDVSDWVRSAATFDVEDGDYFGSGRITTGHGGAVFVEHGWCLEERPGGRAPAAVG